MNLDKLPLGWSDSGPNPENTHSRYKEMHRTNPTSILCAPLAMLLSVTVVDATATDQSLLGCWRSEQILQVNPDGASHNDTSGRCLAKFTTDQMTSACGALKESIHSVIVYSYRVTAPGVFSATMTAHNRRPDLIGSSKATQYRIENGLLYLTSNPQTTLPAPPTRAIRVESVSRSVPCPQG